MRRVGGELGGDTGPSELKLTQSVQLATTIVRLGWTRAAGDDWYEKDSLAEPESEGQRP